MVPRRVVSFNEANARLKGIMSLKNEVMLSDTPIDNDEILPELSKLHNS